ncbi:Predicted dehydrogenase [Hyunsoonleella jejuensis]|uniref:Predicted dehydrogenase n=1 Tax=Hyunsoonleella jejuensis TaxID=419940 RepID=A0A1H9LFT3_9FLAO|nr:Gfo/Idh/MocA family oxidoreductase [Hyunsoonleella jejuensis]SER10244.1 Predicted dehydrogenase [Hyunsoonleella jejuensis]
MKTIKWGFIGCGSVTEVKSGPAYQLTEGFEVVAVMRRNIEKAKDYAKRHNINTFYNDADALINDENVDAIYIATPPDSHKTYALKVAKAGKPCCIEKPITPNYQDSSAILNAFQSANIPLFVAYYRRSLPRFLKVKSWLDDHKIGEIRHVNWLFCKPPNNLDLNKTYNWRTDAKIAPGGYFDDLASHGLDLLAFYLGEFKDAKGICANQQHLYDAYDTISATWIHENGVTGTGSWNFGSNERIDNVTIIGSKGTITFSIFQDNAIQLKTKDFKESLVIDNPKHIQQYHVEGIRDALIINNFKHPSTGATAVHTSWVTDKILGQL